MSQTTSNTFWNFVYFLFHLMVSFKLILILLYTLNIHQLILHLITISINYIICQSNWIWFILLIAFIHRILSFRYPSYPFIIPFITAHSFHSTPHFLLTNKPISTQSFIHSIAPPKWSTRSSQRNRTPSAFSPRPS